MITAFGIAELAQNCVIVGDYNFDSTWVNEESVITSKGFKDVVH